ncbi:tetratricopeptide repeat-containing sulfotransferase family protein [Kordiimonas marina]|uniref:tetratricopeptide repeat-containing sulfotransferase family protein n=1 Tax=Kordiimonas marina TaxID=2872312 RepID=UPI001FF54D01|nr:tetratricopeptide repeat-containing sulfotransferase family protein [Kordiimonas marina]MCJ9430640.1 sulfotransferase [Kordiimonas marina]
MASTAQAPVGTLATAFAHTARLLGVDPALAEEQAREILKAVPGHPEGEMLLGAALRLRGDARAALAVLGPLAQAQPRYAAAHYELGLTLAALGRGAEAIQALRHALGLRPDLINAWRALGDALTLAGDEKGADEAYARHIQASVKDPQLMEAAVALLDNKLAVAEHTLRDYLKGAPTDVAALRMLAEVGSRLGRYEDAANLLARSLELAPSFIAARHNYATVLHRLNRIPEALDQIDTLLKTDPNNPGYRILRASALVRIGNYDEAIEVYEAVLETFGGQPKAWMSYGHALKTVGRQADAIAAYEKSVTMQPSLGEAYWSLANLKTFRFSDAQLAAMEQALTDEGLEKEDRFHLHFALGKAYEDVGAYEQSFAHYEKGNASRRDLIDYDADDNSAHVARSRALFDKGFFAARAGQGSDAPDPIFIVGLPRAGSTLVEQILSSHSMVEGTMELPDIITMAKRLGGKKKRNESSVYPEVLGDLSADDLKALGEEYLERTRIQRKLGRPFFIDKMPNNFAHTGFIHLILPNAKIIDARRHPLGCCFSAFKQHFARGQNFTYAQEDVARYYRDYVALMAHFDAVLPGRVHRVIYENMVADTEAEIRRLLDYCGLPFEEGVLRYYENDRAVRTASSEQVRKPIFTDAVEHWRHFEPWIGPMKDTLGPILETYPEVPDMTGNGGIHCTE